MRNFWIAIGILAIVAAVVLWRSGAAGDDNALQTGDALIASNAGGKPAPAIDAREQVNPLRSPGASSVESTKTAPPNSDALKPADATTIKPTASDAQALADDLMNSAQNDAQRDPEAGGGEDELAGALDDGSIPAPGGDDAEVAAASSEGATIDGKYIVAGDGTAENPFEITWDLLILASQTYQPRLGKTELPPQVTAVNGKHIKIAGYFAVPMASTDPKEVLFMLNMWDGCCIGMPPSPYDAIEVRLKEPLSGRKQYVTYGTLSGTLVVDPYVQNGWLLGMYLMEDGTLDVGL